MPRTNRSVDPRYSRWKWGFANDYWAGCGFGTENRFNFERRPMKLPDDPTLILGAGYLKCERIDISILEPRVHVESYPTGYFGDHVYENVLIEKRVEFSDEAVLRQLFFLMVEAATGVDDNWSFLLDDMNADLNVADFRKATGFIPELLIEFVGETNVRVEMNLNRRRVLILSGDRWEVYELHSKSAAAVENIAIKGPAALQ